MPVRGIRAVVVGTAVCVMACAGAQPVFADASGPRTSSPPRTGQTPSEHAPSQGPGTQLADPSQDTDPDSAWEHADHRMRSADSRGRAAGVAGPVNAAGENLPYFGGPVLVHPSVYLIFWGPQWIDGTTDTNRHVERDTAAYVMDFFNGAGGSPWLNSVAQYCEDHDPADFVGGFNCSKPHATPVTNPRKLVLSAIFDPRKVDSNLDDAAVRREARTIWRQQNFNSNAIYFVFTPSRFVTSDLGSKTCAYHGWEVKGLSNIWFAYMPYMSDFPNMTCWTHYVNQDALGTTIPYKPGSPYNDGTLDGFSIVGGHELAEAITDPAVRGPKVTIPKVGSTNLSIPAWITLDGNENGDLCTAVQGVPPWDTPYGDVWLPAISDGRYHAFAVQPLWSDADDGCPLGYPLRGVVPLADNGAFGHTTIDVQSRGTTTSWFSIQYFDSNPSSSATSPANSVGFGDGNEVLRAHAVWSVGQAADHHSLPEGGSGTALIYGREPAQVTVRESSGAAHDATAFAGVRPGAGTATTLTAADIDFSSDPAAHRTTRLNVVNAGSTTTSVSVAFRGADGSVKGATPSPLLLHAGEGTSVTPADAGIAGNFVGSATISSAAGDSQHPYIERLPLAAAVTTDRTPNHALSTYLATPSSGPFGDATVLNAPLLYGQIPSPAPSTAGPAQLSYRTIAAGSDFGLALKTDGTVVAWGGNEAGQLGNAVNVSPGAQPSPSGSPVPVRDGTGAGLLSGVISVQAGASFSIALKADGTVWGWGADGRGQLGNGGTTNVSIPTQVLGPGGNGFLANIVSIASGFGHTVAVRSDGSVWTWGDDSDGQLGDNGSCQCFFSTTPIQVVSPSGTGFFQDAVAAAPGYGASHSAVIKKDGTVWAWGDNFAYQSGRTTSSTILVPTEIFGPGGAGFLQGVVELSMGYGFNVALLADGTTWGWGDSLFHQLGTNLDSFDNTNARFPVFLAGGVMAMTAWLDDITIVKADGTVLVQGDNRLGEAGFSTGNSDVQMLTAVPGVSGGTQVAGGDSFGFAVTQGGNVWSWGNNQDGALGQGNVPACLFCGVAAPPGLVVSDTGVGPLAGIALGADLPVTDKAIARLAVGQQFSLALTSAGTVVAWGTDNRGQLGDKNNQPVTTPKPVQGLTRVKAIAAGLGHSLALTEQGTVYAWGFGLEGQLGLGDTNDRAVPTPVTGLPPIVAIAAGGNHSLALDASGQLWAWGFNADGELGDGTTTNQLRPEKAANNLLLQQISGGLNFSIAVDLLGRVFAWGANDFGQLGDGTTNPSVLPKQVTPLPNISLIASGLRTSYALDFSGNLYAWGEGQNGELGDGHTGLTADSHVPLRVVATDGVTPLTNVQGVAAGWGVRAFAQLSDGTLLAWGSTAAGALGNGQDVTGTPAPVLTAAAGAHFGPVRTIGVGYEHTVAVEPDGSGWSWGDNQFGELGSGSPATSIPFPEPIPALPGVAGLPAGGGGGGNLPPPPFTSRLVVANPGDLATGVTVHYRSAAGVVTTFGVPIAAHGQAIVDQASPDGPPADPNPYTAVITSDQGISAVAEILPTDPASARATAYSLFADGSVDLGVPLVEHAGPDGLSTSLVVMGVGPVPALATVTYLDGLGVAIKSVTLTVPSGGAVVADQASDLGVGTVAAVTLTAAVPLGHLAVLEVGSGRSSLTSVSIPSG